MKKRILPFFILVGLLTLVTFEGSSQKELIGPIDDPDPDPLPSPTGSLWYNSGTNVYLNSSYTRVGIGITNPTVPLDVVTFNSSKARLYTSSTTGVSELEVSSGGAVRGVFQSNSTSLGLRSGTTSSHSFHLITNNQNRLTIGNTGNVSIANGLIVNGLTQLNSGLEVRGGVTLTEGNQVIYTSEWDENYIHNFVRLANSTYHPTLPSGLKAGGLVVSDDFNYSNPDRNDLVVKGNVRINTPTNPQGYQLAVNGKIGAKDIKLEAVSWPDYVFSAQYQLRPLKDLEAFIRENKHLPEVPSAAEVEENGYSMGDLDKTLLKKVEELTLYVIEQQKQIEELKRLVEEKKR
jgi:hypothetical protein